MDNVEEAPETLRVLPPTAEVAWLSREMRPIVELNLWRLGGNYPVHLDGHGNTCGTWIQPDAIERVANTPQGRPRPRGRLVERDKIPICHDHHHSTASRGTGNQIRRPRHLVRSIVLDLAL